MVVAEAYEEVHDSMSNSSGNSSEAEDPEAQENKEIDMLFETAYDLDRADTRKRVTTANALISPQPASRDIFHIAKR